MVFLVWCQAEPNYSPGTVTVVIGIASEQFFPPDSVDLFASTQDRMSSAQDFATYTNELNILPLFSLCRAFCKTQANSSPQTASLYDDWILD